DAAEAAMEAANAMPLPDVETAPAADAADDEAPAQPAPEPDPANCDGAEAGTAGRPARSRPAVAGVPDRRHRGPPRAGRRRCGAWGRPRAAHRRARSVRVRWPAARGRLERPAREACRAEPVCEPPPDRGAHPLRQAGQAGRADDRRLLPGAAAGRGAAG